LLDALQGKEPPPEPKGLPRLDIRHLRVSGAQVQVSDQRVTPAFATAIEPLDLDLTDVSTLPDDAGKFRLTAKTLSGAQLTWAGDLTLNPIASAGRIDVVGIDLQRLAPLLQDQLPIAPPSGIAAFGADYRLAQAGGTLGLRLEKIGLMASALRLQQGSGVTLPQLAVDRVEIKEGSFDLGTGQLGLGAIELHGNRVEAMLDGTERKPVLTLDQIALANAKVDFTQRKATLAALTLKGGGISARRDAQGRIDLLGLIDSFGKQPAAKTAAAAKPSASPSPALSTAPAAPWRFNVGQVSLTGFTATLRDESVAPAVELGLDNIAIAVDGVSENFKAPLPLKASLDVSSGGRLEVAGTLTPAMRPTSTKLANLQGRR
jgi:hypothetical protein